MEQNIRRYHDHVIEVRPSDSADRVSPSRSDAAEPPSSPDAVELLIDDEPVTHGRLFDGSLYLAENAYEWGDDLGELAEKLIDYRDQASEVRRRGGPEA